MWGAAALGGLGRDHGVASPFPSSCAVVLSGGRSLRRRRVRWEGTGWGRPEPASPGDGDGGEDGDGDGDSDSDRDSDRAGRLLLLGSQRRSSTAQVGEERRGDPPRGHGRPTAGHVPRGPATRTLCY